MLKTSELFNAVLVAAAMAMPLVHRIPSADIAALHQLLTLAQAAGYI